MTSLTLTNVKDFMSHLLLNTTFDHFIFVEGEITTFCTFRLDGFIQKDFFDTGAELPEYSSWKYLKDYCYSIIRGKRTPLGFRFVFGLSDGNIRRTIEQNSLNLRPEEVRGLYLNIRYDGKNLVCVTGTSFQTFNMDKTLEHVWDDMVKNFFRQKQIEFE